MLRVAILAGLLVAGACGAVAQPIQGRALVIDGDTLEVDRRQLRLHGMDAQEIGQASHYIDGIPDVRGRGVEMVLMALTEAGRVRWESVAAPGAGLPTARCCVGDIGLAAELVRQGRVWVLPSAAAEYGELERQASAASLGAWGPRSTAPWEHRAALVREASQALAPASVIKTVTARSGDRSCVPPCSPWRGAVKVETRRGDRWHFDKASAAGAGASLPRNFVDSIVSGAYDDH